MRRKVPNAFSSRSKLTNANLSSDNMGDVARYYGWSANRLDQEIRAHCEGASRQEIKKIYHQACDNKEREK